MTQKPGFRSLVRASVDYARGRARFELLHGRTQVPAPDRGRARLRSRNRPRRAGRKRSPTTASSAGNGGRSTATRSSTRSKSRSASRTRTCWRPRQRFRAARDAVRIARSALYPTVGAGATVTNSRSGSTVQQLRFRHAQQFPVVRSSISPTRRTCGAASGAPSRPAPRLPRPPRRSSRMRDCPFRPNSRQDYFQLHGLDSTVRLLEDTVKSYEENLTLTKNRFAGGVASGGDVAQAETQLSTVRAQLTDVGVARTQFEHAIAVLTGKAPSEVSIAPQVLGNPPPPDPGRHAVGAARAPARRSRGRTPDGHLRTSRSASPRPRSIRSIGISASAGLQGSNLVNLFSWPARFWSLGPNISQVVLRRGTPQGGSQGTAGPLRRHGRRLSTDCVDCLPAGGGCVVGAADSGERKRPRLARRWAAQRSLDISNAQYKAGVVSYLQVITAQQFVLQNQRSAVDVLTRRITSSVQLIEALGGGWDASQLPTVESLKSGSD